MLAGRVNETITHYTFNTILVSPNSPKLTVFRSVTCAAVRASTLQHGGKVRRVPPASSSTGSRRWTSTASCKEKHKTGRPPMVPVRAEKVPPDEVGGTRTGLRPKRSAPPDEVGCRARTESRNRISAEISPRTMRLVARTAFWRKGRRGAAGAGSVSAGI